MYPPSTLSPCWSASGLPLPSRAQICLPTTFTYMGETLSTLPSLAPLLDSPVRLSYVLHTGAPSSPSLWHPLWQNRVRGEPVFSFDQATLSNPSEPHALLGFSCLHLHTLPTLVTVSVSCPVIHVRSGKRGLFAMFPGCGFAQDRGSRSTG